MRAFLLTHPAPLNPLPSSKSPDNNPANEKDSQLPTKTKGYHLYSDKK